MQAGSVATGDGTTLTTTLSDYEGKIGGLASSWKGTSYDSFNNQTTAFVSEYKPIADQLNSFGSACDEYIKYEQLKKDLIAMEEQKAQMIANNETSGIATINNEIETTKRDIESTKAKINDALSSAGSTKLEATALSASVASSVGGDSASATATAATSGAVSASEYAIAPHSNATEADRAARLAVVGGECGSQAEQDSKMTTIDVPYWDGSQEQTMKLTVNQNLVSNYQNVFRQLTDMKWTVDPSITGAYDYNHTPRPSGAPSDHTLGSAIDINWDHNWVTGDGSSMAVRGNEAVIEAFANQGFYWGGDWRSSKDDMHFTFTGY